MSPATVKPNSQARSRRTILPRPLSDRPDSRTNWRAPGVFFQRGEARVPPGPWHGSGTAPWDGVREQNRPIVWVGHPALSRSPPARLPHYTHDVMIHRPQPSNPRESGASPVVRAGRVPGVGRQGPRYPPTERGGGTFNSRSPPRAGRRGGGRESRRRPQVRGGRRGGTARGRSRQRGGRAGGRACPGRAAPAGRLG